MCVRLSASATHVSAGVTNHFLGFDGQIFSVFTGIHPSVCVDTDIRWLGCAVHL